jgi:IS5 family transposase
MSTSPRAPQKWTAPRPDRSRGGRPPCWTKQHGKSYVDYKLSANADKRHKLIHERKLSTASEHDTNHFEDVLDTANTRRAVLADNGYVGGERETRLTDAGWRLFILRKSGKDKPLSLTQERRNRRIVKASARVEHVFAGLTQLGGEALRSVGLASGR